MCILFIFAGLYKVVSVEEVPGVTGFKVIRYLFVRYTGQDPIQL